MHEATMTAKLMFVVVFSILACSIVTKELDVICYYGTWAKWRQGNGKFTASAIDPNLCDKIIVAFAAIDGSYNLIEAEAGDMTIWQQVSAYKQKNPKLKVLLAVGGANQGSTYFTPMVKDSAKRSTFIKSAVSLLKKINFDGLDLDWEFPASSEISNFNLFSKELQNSFKSENLILTVAMGASPSRISSSYDLAAMAPYFEYIGLMTYDYYGCGWGISTLEHHAPLYPRKNALGTLSVNESMTYASKLVDKSKLVMGLPTYGRIFGMASSSAPGSQAGSGCPAGKYTRENGITSYMEICEKLKDNKLKTATDTIMKVSYAYGNGEWVGYDDVKTLEEKIQYAKKNGYYGVMLWTLDLDDFSNVCGQGKYPLLSAIYKAAHGNDGSGSTTEETTKSSATTSSTTETKTTASASSDTTKTTETTTESTGGSGSSDKDKVCKMHPNGSYADKSTQCRKYITCQTGQVMPCPTGLRFSNEKQTCDYEENVPCN